MAKADFADVAIGIISFISRFYYFKIGIKNCRGSGGGGANTKVPDMYGVGVFSGPKAQK